MNQQSVKDYFVAYPNLTECFETYDGVLHPLESEAKRWIGMNVQKHIKTHANPAHSTQVEVVALPTDVETAEKVKTLVKEIAELNAEIKRHKDDKEIDLNNADVKLYVAATKEQLVAKKAELKALQ